MDDISETLIAKSDQLNAADLVGGGLTVEVLAITVNKGADQPVIISIGEGRQPYKPCKTMRRLLAIVWGTYSVNWVGQSMTLYCDMEVMWGGVPTGGIRVSHVTGIAVNREIPLRSSKHKVTTYIIQPLSIELPDYLDSSIKSNKANWIELFKGDLLPENLINSIGKKYKLTDAQKLTIRGLAPQSP